MRDLAPEMLAKFKALRDSEAALSLSATIDEALVQWPDDAYIREMRAFFKERLMRMDALIEQLHDTKILVEEG